MTIQVGDAAPEIPEAGVSGPHALTFYKVTCPTCQMAAPVFDRFATAYPGAVVGVGQDPPRLLERFADEHGVRYPSVSDVEPYAISAAYDIEHVPTLVVVDGDGIVRDLVESWDREGTNRAARTLAELLGTDAVVISAPEDGVPAFRPG
jgi:thiol-disulfide isomerase/thioredoxin